MRWSLRRASSAVVGVGVIWAVVGFLMVSGSVAGNQEELLKERATEATTVIQSLVSQVQSGFTALGTVITQAHSVTPVAGQLNQSAVSGLALFHADARGAAIAGQAGALRNPPVGTRGTLSPSVASALARTGFQFTAVSGSGAGRTLSMVAPLPGLGAGWGLYGELQLPASAEIIKQAPGTAFSDLDFAVYLGRAEAPAAVLLSNTQALPLQGSRATVVAPPSSTGPVTVQVGDAAQPGASHAGPGDLLLVFTARGFLGGTLASMMPWLVTVTVLLTTLLITAVVEAALRRRDEALTHARRLQSALVAVEDAERSFRRLFDDHPNPMWVYDRDTLGFLDVNDAAMARYGYSKEEFTSLRVTELVPPEDVDRLSEVVADGRPVIERSGPWRNRLRNGREIWVEITLHEQEFAGRRAGLVLAQDVTERVQLEEQLKHQAFHDALTNLANRALFADRVDQAIARAARSGKRCAVLLLDLDDFKTINDSLGHAAGDELLVQAAARLRSELRASDTAARLGGDEFCVLLEDLDDVQAAVLTAQRLVEVLRAPYDVGGSQMVTSVSIGVCLTDGDTTKCEDLLRNADVAMYAAKGSGKGRWEVYERAQHLQVSERHALQHDLARAVSGGELSLVYQPQLDLRSRRVVGVEALVRWNHPRRGAIGPDVFIPIAERSGLITEIDEWVLETACRQVQRWAETGLPHLRVAVNVSGRELDDEQRLVSAVARTLEATGIRPGDVEIELTESVAVSQHERALAILRRLRQLRVQVAIDDFGTGHSALSRLKDFSPDRIKIDRAFVAGLDSDASQRALVGAMIAMGHSLGLSVLAEGVETVEELHVLVDDGCDEVQGYLVSRPRPAADLEPLLRDPAIIESQAYWAEVLSASTLDR